MIDDEQLELQTIAERDAAEDCASDMYTEVTGRQAEWSNCFGYSDALEEVAFAVSSKAATIAEQREEIARLKGVVGLAELALTAMSDAWDMQRGNARNADDWINECNEAVGRFEAARREQTK